MNALARRLYLTVAPGAAASLSLGVSNADQLGPGDISGDLVPCHRSYQGWGPDRTSEQSFQLDLRCDHCQRASRVTRRTANQRSHRRVSDRYDLGGAYQEARTIL